MRSVLVIFFSLLGLYSQVQAQLVIDETYTGEDLVDLLVGDGVVVTNVVLNCADGASGYFDGSGANVGIPSGVLLTTGLVQDANGPNSTTGAGGSCFGTPGDPHVEGVSGSSTFDGCILDFDIVPTCSQVSFTFVFGSEEYPENINNEFSDAMVITISGPGFTGSENIALVPGTSSAVSVKNVNGNQNSGYYVNNSGGGSVEYDGFTTPITATANVTSCERYHIKIAVADGADCIFNSGLFVEEGSIDCGVDNAIMTEYDAGPDPPIEGCRSYDIEFCRQGSTVDAYDLNISLEGTAINGTDYDMIGNTVSFAAGQQCQTLTINPIVDGTVEGPETIVLIYEAISGNCVVNDTIHIELQDDQGLVPDFYFNDVCDQNTVFFNNATTITPPATATQFTWKLGDGTVLDQYNATRLYDVPGTYEVWLIASSTDGCVDSVSHDVTVYDYPEADFTLSGDVCLGEKVTFINNSVDPTNDAVGGVTWNFGDGVSAYTWDVDHTYSIPDTFPVLLAISTDILGCTDEYRDTLIVYPAIFTDFVAANVCLGNTVNFINHSQGVGQWEWNFDDGSPLESTFDVSHDYSYADTFDVQLVGISPNGCNDTTVKQVFVYDAPQADFSIDNVCSNVLAKYTNLSVAPTMGDLSSWFWVFSDQTSASAFNPTHEFPGPGSYTATLIVYSSNLSCSDTLTLPIEVYPIPEPDFTVANTCDEKAVKPENLTPGSVALWEWDFGDGTGINNAQVPTHLYDTSGFYDIWLQATTVNGCTDSVMRSVIIYSLPQAAFETITVCEGVPTTFFNQSEIGFPDNIVEWAWTFGDGTPRVLAVNPEHEYADGGIYNVRLRVSSGNGCLDSVSVPVQVYYAPDPDVIITMTEGCSPVCADFYDASTISSGGIVEWRWNFGDLQTSTNRNEHHCYFSEEIYESTFYDVSLRTVSDRGCVETLIIDSLIEVYPTPYADFSWDPDSVSMFDPRVFFEDGSYGADFWTWDFGDSLNISSSNLQNPMYQFPHHGTYDVILNAENADGCSDTTLKELTVHADFRFYAPNSFTPNNDGHNEFFRGEGAGILEYNMLIYDRWGNLVFESAEQDYMWDGTTDGKVCPQGQYVYHFRLVDVNRNEHQFVGEVMLVR